MTPVRTGLPLIRLDDTTQISADKSGLMYVWTLPSYRIIYSTKLEATQNFTLASDGSWMLVIENTQIHKLSLPFLQSIAVSSIGSKVLSIAINHAGNRIAVSTEDGRVALMDEKLSIVTELFRPSRDAHDLHFSPDGNQWLSLGRQTDSNVRLVDAGSNRVLRRFKAHELCGWQARFSPDGRYAASSAEDGSVHIYDLHEPYRPVILYPEFDD